ncbi:MAG: ABC transporter ATP-binding protein [Pirellulales bacterium]|nr:ABC transporter ATP-binding protein [Pirellulales bacterium]
MTPVIKLNSLSKRFGSQVALDRVSLDVPPGSVFALLGENGAGKTTAIRIMLGLAEADSGKASVLGLDSATHGIDIRRSVGYVPERPVLYDWMTVDEVGWFVAGFHGDGFLTRYRQTADRFDLPGRKKIKTLSKGARAKVVLSLALAGDPELLVLDEPTSGLDAMVRREFLESMVDRAATGKTVFLSSHQIGEVERVADIVAMIHHGRLLMVESLDELKKQTRQLVFTLADGVGSPPDVPGRVLARCRRARQWQVIVADLVETSIAELRRHPAVESLEVRTPTLEEIFVAHMQAGRQSASEEVSA